MTRTFSSTATWSRSRSCAVPTPWTTGSRSRAKDRSCRRATPASCPTHSRAVRKWCSRDGLGRTASRSLRTASSRNAPPSTKRRPQGHRDPSAMPALGSFILLAAFVVAAYAIVASVSGARRRSTRLIESGVGAFYAVTALMTVASGVLVHAFVTDNYSIKYVQRYSDSAQPLAYKIASYWGGLDGSIMFWVFLLGAFGAVAVHVNRVRHRELIPYVVAIIAVVEMFFIFLMVVHKNPFSTFLTPP